MAVFELVLALLFVGAMLAAVALRLNAPYPVLLALAGAALALLPNVPTVTLDPQLALTLFVAPVLLDAAPLQRRHRRRCLSPGGGGAGLGRAERRGDGARCVTP